MRCRLLIALLSFFASAVPCIAQTAIPVTPCDLVTSPQKYAGKVVEVRGSISLSFENFSLAHPECADKDPGVWLMYGGDEDTPTTSTVNDHDRKPGSVIKIDGIPIPLVRDANLELFKKRLAAIRLGMIGDANCYSDCNLFNVTATLTGLFFAATDNAREHIGYGHLGCCHLLAIEKVADVDAERSSIPTGPIRCSADSKNLTKAEAERLNSIRTKCEGLSRSECERMAFRQMEAVAAFWGDSIHFDDGFLDADIADEHIETSGWLTLDRLHHYELSIRSQKSGDDPKVVLGGTAARVSCKVVAPPPPLSETESQVCRYLFKQLRSTPGARKFNPKFLGENLHDRADEMQRLESQAADKIDAAAKTVGLTIEPGTKAVTCDPIENVYRGKEFGGCFWNNDRGTMLIGISLIRSWPPKKNADERESTWVLTRVSATVCQAEK